MKIDIIRITFQERKVLQKILKKSDIEIGLGDVDIDSKQCKEFMLAKKKLAEDYPLDYILGEVDFLEKKFVVNENVLIPREETEYWVDGLIKSKINGDLLIDMGAGSGIIGISLAHCFDIVYLADVSKNAADVSQRNIQNNNLKNTQVIISDLFENDDLKKVIDTSKEWTLIANLPYLPESEKKYKYVNKVNYEPEIALYSGVDGLDLFRKMAYQLSQMKLPNEIYLELDPENLEKAAIILEKIGFDVSIRIDIFGKNRFLVGQRVI